MIVFLTDVGHDGKHLSSPVPMYKLQVLGLSSFTVAAVSFIPFLQSSVDLQEAKLPATHVPQYSKSQNANEVQSLGKT